MKIAIVVFQLQSHVKRGNSHTGQTSQPGSRAARQPGNKAVRQTEQNQYLGWRMALDLPQNRLCASSLIKH